MKLRLKKDIVIKAGAIFESVDNETRKYYHDNYGHIFGLTKDTSGEIIYGIYGTVNGVLGKQSSKWFEKVEE
jgi:hypothetical protein